MYKKLATLLSGLSALLVLGAGCIDFGGSSAQGPMGMFRSADKGETWNQINALPTPQGVKSLAGLNVYKVFTDPSDPNALYIGSRNQGLYYSYTNGDSWQTVDAFAGKYIYAVTVDPKNKCTVFVADSQHIYKTTDCMRTWTLVYTEERPGQHVVGMAADWGDSTYVYAAILGGDVLVSQDSGMSWRVSKRFDFQLQDLQTDPKQAGRIYVASYERGLYKSEDRGLTWSDLSENFKDFNDSKRFYRMVLHPSRANSLFWISKYGILRSDDAGVTWVDLKLITAPGSVNIYAFAVNPGNEKEMYYVGTILGDKNVPVRSTFYKSNDGGTSWVTKKLPSNTVPISLLIQPKQNNVLFMGFASL